MNLILFALLISAWVHAAPIDLPFRESSDVDTLGTVDVINRRGKLSPPPEAVDARELNQIFFSELDEQNASMRKVKYYLLNGETRLAQVYLTKLSYTQTKLKPVVYRYLAILSFIEGKFSRSLEYLSKKELQSLPQYAKICTLKVLNQIVLDKVNQIESEWAKCHQENFTHFNAGNFVWIQTLVQMKLKPQVGLTKIPFKGLKLSSMENDQLKIFLKLALYLNQEKMLASQINELDLTQIKDEEVRELVGHLFLRLGSLAKSYRFIEDLKSPNAENIKGNLYILRNKYELAYAQFKLALELKQNSQNAMERILPLAWLLGDWEGGAQIAERVIASPQTQINKMTLVSAFYTQKGDYVKAKEVLDAIVAKSRRGAEVDVTQIHSFVGLMQNLVPVIKKQSAQSCDQYDMVNCWVGLQMEQWDSFPLTLRRTEKLPNKKEWERLSQSEVSQPLTETVYVNQLDVEELDDKLIKLIPNTP